MIERKTSQLNMISGYNGDDFDPWQLENKNILSSCYEEKRLHHALLLVGSKFVGKRNFAINFARFLLCISPISGKACNACKSCKLSLSDGHPDGLILLEENINKYIRVDEIRELQDRFQQTSQQGGNKVCIISPAEGMNENASNCLLKILEEPPKKTYFILISDNPMSILPTISSRCQRVNFSKPSNQTIQDWLSAKDNDEEFKLALNLGKGFPYLVKKIFEDKNNIFFSDSMLYKLIKNEISIYDFSNKLDLTGSYEFLNSFIKYILELMSLNSERNEKNFYLDNDSLEVLLNMVFSAKKSIYKNANHRLLIESLLLECQSFIKVNR